MKTLYITSPISKWKFDEDTTPLMIDEVRRRGGTTWMSTPREISVVDGVLRTRCRTIELHDESPFHCLGQDEDLAMGDFDVIHLRTDPPFDLEYYYTTIFLDMVPANTLVLNRPSSVRYLNEKLAILLFPDYITDTIVTFDVEEGADFVERVGGKAVAKELSQCSSLGITLLEGSREENIKALSPLVNSGGGQIMIQRFLTGVVDGETRITMIDGKALGYMKKVPKKGSFLASMDFGAVGVACELTDRDKELCKVVGEFLQKEGILFAALDVIDGHLSEVNLTSPGLMRHTNSVMGIKLEEALEDAVEKWLAAHR